jgi:hypothetical protein
MYQYRTEEPRDRYRTEGPQEAQHTPGHRVRNTVLVVVALAAAFALGATADHLWQDRASVSGGSGSNPPAAAPAEPATAAGVQQAANTYFGFYAAGQYATAYTLLSPSARAAISETTWTGAHQACISRSPQLAYAVTQPVVSGTTAVVRVAVQGALSKLGSEEASFTYSGGRWWYSPPDMSAYQGHTTTQAVAALKAAGTCSG